MNFLREVTFKLLIYRSQRKNKIFQYILVIYSIIFIAAEWPLLYTYAECKDFQERHLTASIFNITCCPQSDNGYQMFLYKRTIYRSRTPPKAAIFCSPADSFIPLTLCAQTYSVCPSEIFCSIVCCCDLTINNSFRFTNHWILQALQCSMISVSNFKLNIGPPEGHACSVNSSNVAEAVGSLSWFGPGYLSDDAADNQRTELSNKRGTQNSIAAEWGRVKKRVAELFPVWLDSNASGFV